MQRGIYDTWETMRERTYIKSQQIRIDTDQVGSFVTISLRILSPDTGLDHLGRIFWPQFFLFTAHRPCARGASSVWH